MEEQSSSSTGAPQEEYVSRQEMSTNFAKVFEMLERLSKKNDPGPPPQVANTSSSGGECLVSGPNETLPVSATAPTFIPVNTTAGTVSAPIVQGIQGLPDIGSTAPFLLLGAQGAPASKKTMKSISVSSGLPPVPGYLVERIKNNKYIEFAMLRPVNLKKLPAEEPVPTEFARLIRAVLEPIRNFAEWSEAWAVFAGVVVTMEPERMSKLIAYFLLISGASKDFPGNGWLDYDSSFRRQAADSPGLSWEKAFPLHDHCCFKGHLQPCHATGGFGSNMLDVECFGLLFFKSLPL